MDAKTNTKPRLPSRQVTAGSMRASRRSYLYATGLGIQQVAGLDSTANAALHSPITRDCSTKIDGFSAVEIFKKTPCAAGLKPGGRDVAQDMPEVDGIPLLTKTLLDHGYPDGDSFTVTDRMIAENLKTVTLNPHQDVARSADKPITVTGDLVGLKGNMVLQTVIGGSITLLEDGLLEDGDLIEIDADGGVLNVKLTDEELAARRTKWKPRATNHTSRALWKYARQVGPAMDVAVILSGGAHEKQCYADI